MFEEHWDWCIVMECNVMPWKLLKLIQSRYKIIFIKLLRRKYFCYGDYFICSFIDCFVFLNTKVLDGIWNI